MNITTAGQTLVQSFDVSALLFDIFPETVAYCFWYVWLLPLSIFFYVLCVAAAILCLVLLLRGMFSFFQLLLVLPSWYLFVSCRYCYRCCRYFPLPLPLLHCGCALLLCCSYLQYLRVNSFTCLGLFRNVLRQLCMLFYV